MQNNKKTTVVNATVVFVIQEKGIRNYVLFKKMHFIIFSFPNDKTHYFFTQTYLTKNIRIRKVFPISYFLFPIS